MGFWDSDCIEYMYVFMYVRKRTCQIKCTAIRKACKRNVFQRVEEFVEIQLKENLVLVTKM